MQVYYKLTVQRISLLYRGTTSGSMMHHFSSYESLQKLHKLYACPPQWGKSKVSKAEELMTYTKLKPAWELGLGDLH